MFASLFHPDHDQVDVGDYTDFDVYSWEDEKTAHTIKTLVEVEWVD